LRSSTSAKNQPSEQKQFESVQSTSQPQSHGALLLLGALHSHHGTVQRQIPAVVNRRQGYNSEHTMSAVWTDLPHHFAGRVEERVQRVPELRPLAKATARKHSDGVRCDEAALDTALDNRVQQGSVGGPKNGCSWHLQPKQVGLARSQLIGVRLPPSGCASTEIVPRQRSGQAGSAPQTKQETQADIKRGLVAEQKGREGKQEQTVFLGQPAHEQLRCSRNDGAQAVGQRQRVAAKRYHNTHEPSAMRTTTKRERIQ
jgi:hypothetical protein